MNVKRKVKMANKKRTIKIKTKAKTKVNKSYRKAKVKSKSSELSHSIWKGYISFGLVNIPVILYSAENPREEIHFKLLDKHNLASIKYLRINAETKKEVPWENIVKGYEYESGNYAVLTEKDLESIAIKNSKTIEIEDFIALEELSSVYFDKPYYLLPGKGGEKGYVLLREILIRTQKIGIARVMIHTHQYLAAIIPYENVIMINTIRYPEEIKSPTELGAPLNKQDYKITKKEFEIAEQLVNTMTNKWDPKRYNNLHREEVMKLVHKKIASGKKGAVKEVKSPAIKQTNVVDFMALLKKSLKEKEIKRKKGHG